MTAIAFDTLRFVERLEVAGMPRMQAKANAEALAEVLEKGTEELTTQNDVRTLQSELKGDIRALQSEINALRSEHNSRFMLLHWMIGFSLALNVAIFLKLMT